MTKITDRPLRIFLSHASEDKSAVRALRNLLGEGNIDVWFDEERILPGQSWESEIRNGLEKADVVIVCLSKNLVNKEGYIQRELRMALKIAEEKPENTIYLIPLKLEECETPSSFEHLQWVNLFYDNGEFKKSILNRIMLSLRKRAESLGLIWTNSTLFQGPTTITNQENDDKKEDKQRKIINIETESRNKKTRQKVGVTENQESDELPQTPITLRQSKDLNITTVKNNAALIIYVIDTSGTMGKPLKEKTRLDFVRSALNEAIGEMANHSTVLGKILPKYRVAIYTYSDTVQDILNGIKTIDELIATGLPKFRLMSKTNTAVAFSEIEKLLRQELPDMQNAPAPLICHITDGKFTDDNPSTIAQRIMGMSVKQGNVLIENIYICDDMLVEPIGEIKKWNGLTNKSELQNEYAQSLFDMSSPFTELYLRILAKNGFNISNNARMFFPGEYAKEFSKLLLPE